MNFHGLTAKARSSPFATANGSMDCIVHHVRKTSREYYGGSAVLSASRGDGAVSVIRELAEGAGEAGGK